MENQHTVAGYLKTRLEQLGLDRIFGVAGNYTAPFLNTILADETSPIKISGNANELCAGYAADAYARVKGIGAIQVTYSVGAFIALNTIAGGFVEQVPIVLINGAPTNKEDAVDQNAGLLYSHTTGYRFVDIHMFRPITAAAERITNGRQAPFQIDSALTALLTEKRPVYFEVAEDVWRVPCDPPQGNLVSGIHAINTNNAQDIKDAVSATIALIKERPKSIFWAGTELQRFGLEDDFLDLLETVNDLHAITGKEINFVTSPMSKSVVSELHPNFKGCKTMSNHNIEEMVGDGGCVIGLGAWTVGKDTNNQNIRSNSTILASHGGVLVGAKYFPLVDLKSFIAGLKQGFIDEAKPLDLEGISLESPPLPVQASRSLSSGMTYDGFYNALNNWITADDVLVADAGFPLIGAQSLKIKEKGGFVCQAAWLSIGFSVGAATGLKAALPNEKRVIAIVGDGAFHETCQALSDHTALGQNNVVFVINNGVYGIEQYIVNPNPYRPTPTQYPTSPKSSDLQNDIYGYNKLPSWDFVKLAEAFGSTGIKVENAAQLEEVLSTIRANQNRSFLVEICVPSTDRPGVLEVPSQTTVGEDEIDHQNWPPRGQF